MWMGVKMLLEITEVKVIHLPLIDYGAPAYS